MICHDPKYVNLYLKLFNCVWSRKWVINPKRPAQLDRDLVSKKLNLAYEPVFALNS